jgi:hypothetical protein
MHGHMNVKFNIVLYKHNGISSSKYKLQDFYNVDGLCSVWGRNLICTYSSNVDECQPSKG